MPDQTPPHNILKPEQIDRVADALLALTREVWVLRDRQIVLEQVLADRGIEVTAGIDQLQPSPELQTKLDRERDRLIARITEALQGPE